MKLLFFVLMSAPIVLAQLSISNPPSNKSAWDVSSANQAAIQQRGTEALTKEKARSKANLCVKAEKEGNRAIADCLVVEGKTTEQNYLAYIRAIGALLRRSAPGSSAKNQRLPFDAAEDAWHTYREQSCRSMATQWEGGDQAQVAYPDCLLKLTWNHMNELADLYADLWH